MSQLRIFPLLGPILVLYLVADLASSLASWSIATVSVAIAAPVLALLPLVVFRPRGHGRWQLGALGLSLGVSLLGTVPEASSTVLGAAALGSLVTALLVVDLAWTLPEGFLSEARVIGMRSIHGGLTILFVLLLFLRGAQEAFWPAFARHGEVLSSRGWALAGLCFLSLSLLAATIARWSRRAKGGVPWALAANNWAVFALLLACPSMVVAVAIRWTGTWPLFVEQSLALVGAVVLVLGHGAMLDARVQNLSGTGIRRATVLLALMVSSGLLGWAALGQDGAVHLPWLVAALTGTALAVGPAVESVFAAMLSPFYGRVLSAVPSAKRQMQGAGSITELAEAVLPALRDASGDRDAEPFLYFCDPEVEVRIDHAGLAHARQISMPSVFFDALSGDMGRLLVRRELEQQTVRMPSVRSLVETMSQINAELVVPVSFSGELEGAFVLPRGNRKGALVLEELHALQDLAGSLSGPMALLSSKLRAEARTNAAEQRSRQLLEKQEVLDDEVARLRAEAGLWQGGATTRALSSIPPKTYAPAFRALEKRADLIAPLSTPLLLVAEGGTNIDALARRIHERGGRKEAPFVTGDCRATVEAEAQVALFGSVEAGRVTPGWLRLAGSGTLLLLDLPALSLEVQRQLAESFATHEAAPAGGGSPMPVDARVVATAPVGLHTLIERGSIDPELARWLHDCELVVPPLRDRPEDIDSLLWLAVDQACRVQGRETLGVSPDALELLRKHDWPGNEQELQWVVNAAVAKATGGRILPEELPPLGAADAAVDTELLDGSLRDVERHLLSRALDRAEGNKSEAARLLGLKRSTFLDKLRRHGLSEPQLHANGK